MFQEDITPVSPTQSQSVTFQRSEARDWSAPRIWANLSEFKVVKQSALRHCCRPHQLYPRLRAKLRPRLVGKRPTYWWTTGGGPESCGTFKTALRVVKTHPGDTPFRFAQYIVIHTYTVIQLYRCSPSLHWYHLLHHRFMTSAATASSCQGWLKSLCLSFRRDFSILNHMLCFTSPHQALRFQVWLCSDANESSCPKNMIDSAACHESKTQPQLWFDCGPVD